jgi:hypothetical protein
MQPIMNNDHRGVRLSNICHVSWNLRSKPSEGLKTHLVREERER